ncbi:hypothetical protein JXA32_01290 [Candidatus Sumerlaeota bacterium]|nr:hypothetical protein [Candidatus Sumerlaeota bacterium]
MWINTCRYTAVAQLQGSWDQGKVEWENAEKCVQASNGEIHADSEHGPSKSSTGASSANGHDDSGEHKNDIKQHYLGSFFLRILMIYRPKNNVNIICCFCCFLFSYGFIVVLENFVRISRNGKFSTPAEAGKPGMRRHFASE